jgi:hypothetical protein
MSLIYCHSWPPMSGLIWPEPPLLHPSAHPRCESLHIGLHKDATIIPHGIPHSRSSRTLDNRCATGGALLQTAAPHRGCARSYDSEISTIPVENTSIALLAGARLVAKVQRTRSIGVVDGYVAACLMCQSHLPRCAMTETEHIRLFSPILTWWLPSDQGLLCESGISAPCLDRCPRIAASKRSKHTTNNNLWRARNIRRDRDTETRGGSTFVAGKVAPALPLPCWLCQVGDLGQLVWDGRGTEGSTADDRGSSRG